MSSGVDAGVSLGALEITILLSGVLYGVLIIQVLNYFRDYPEDRWWLKALVITVTILDTVVTALNFYSLWHYTIYGFGNVEILQNMHWSLGTAMYFSCLAVFLTQMFYSYRVWKVTQSRFMGTFCFMLAFIRFCFTIASASIEIRSSPWAAIVSHFYWGIVVSLAECTTSEIVIAAALCIALLRARRPSGPTEKILSRLVKFVVGTGLITSLVTLTELICFLSMDNLAWVALLVLSFKLLPNCLLASLNERASMRMPAKEGSGYRGSSRPRDSSWAWSPTHSQNVEDEVQLATDVTVRRSEYVIKDEESIIEISKHPTLATAV